MGCACNLKGRGSRAAPALTSHTSSPDLDDKYKQKHLKKRVTNGEIESQWRQIQLVDESEVEGARPLYGRNGLSTE
jgi:hypothetical protein